VPVALATPRLALEPVALSDAPELCDLLADRALHRYTDSAPPTPDEMRARVARWLVGRSSDGPERWSNWVVRLRATRALIGHVQVGTTDATATLGYLIARPARRRGYAREALVALLAHLRAESVARVEASIDPANAASVALAEQLGLRRVGATEIWAAAL
jgi:RimJ/RimL family protein N-acetyltransferase